MPHNITQPGSYFSTGNPATSIETTPYAPGMLGVRVTVRSDLRSVPATTPPTGRFKTWQYVQGDSGMAVAPFLGAVLWWFNRILYQVTTSPTATGRGNIAGVSQLPAATAFPAGSYFWQQVGGPGTVKLIDAMNTVPTATNALEVIPSATAGKADTIAAGTAATYPTLGTTIGALNLADATVTVNLNIPENP